MGFIASLQDVRAWGWDGKRLLDTLVAMDYATMEGVTPELEGTPEQWVPVFMGRPDTWRLFCEAPECIAGYWNFIPMSDPDYALAKRGAWVDGDVSINTVLPLDRPGVYRAYFSQISLLPAHRTIRNLRLLLGSFLEVLADLAERQVFFDEMCVSVWSDDGLRMAQRFGMQFLGPHEQHGDMFVLSLCPLPSLRLFSKHPRLRVLYAARQPSSRDS